MFAKVLSFFNMGSAGVNTYLALVEYPEKDGAMTAHYLLRRLNRCGEPGPWSETASATIGA